MRKDHNTSIEKEPGIFGLLWNLIYGLFLGIMTYSITSLLIIAFIGGILLVFKLIFEAIKFGGAVGFPYI